MLRFWESKFSQLRPMKSSGGRRYYRPEDVDLLRGIRELLYVDGLTIKGVQKIFREQGAEGGDETRGARISPTGNPAIEAEGRQRPTTCGPTTIWSRRSPPRPGAAPTPRGSP
ncbi:MAG: hypothetical protein KatS3mg118_3132 [Paracoccaceae bacterium]|nr:MAG: hypothetical protein KatS3mg118_3132 [Paracoccaceae bacterium]